MQTQLSTVQVTPLPNGQWNVKYDNQSGNHPGNYPKVGLAKDSGPQLITFEIVGNPQVTFTNDPIWVKAGSKPQPGDSNPQIVWRSGGANKLYVVDWNDNPATATSPPLALHYQLNVNNHAPLDPIIDNGGTTRPPAPQPPPPPPPPPHPKASVQKDASGSALGQIGGFDLSAIVIGLIIGMIIGLILCWLRRAKTDQTVA
jgi:hypothetical protein